jgi:hypothetical protein
VHQAPPLRSTSSSIAESPRSSFAVTTGIWASPREHPQRARNARFRLTIASNRHTPSRRTIEMATSRSRRPPTRGYPYATKAVARCRPAGRAQRRLNDRLAAIGLTTQERPLTAAVAAVGGIVTSSARCGRWRTRTGPVEISLRPRCAAATPLQINRGTISLQTRQSPLSDSNRRPLPYHDPAEHVGRHADSDLCRKHGLWWFGSRRLSGVSCGLWLPKSFHGQARSWRC